MVAPMMRAGWYDASIVGEGDEAFQFAWDTVSIGRIFARPLYRRLIESDAVQRLGDIRFLGAIDYLMHPTGRELSRRRHTRLEHTLSVAQLALIYAAIRNVDEDEEKLIVAAALLHDVGHAPLSHSLEFAFKQKFGLSHHQVGFKIIRGEAPGGLGHPIKTALMDEGLDVEVVIKLIQGELTQSPHNLIFAHPINIDTIEAISRSKTYLKSASSSPRPDIILRALLRPKEGSKKLDQFWELKSQIYQLLIQGPVGLIADYLATDYVRRHPKEVSVQDYFSSEREFRKKHPALFELFEVVRKRLGHPILMDETKARYRARRFFIDANKPPGDPDRYQVAKRLKVIPFADLKSLIKSDLVRPAELPI